MKDYYCETIENGKEDCLSNFITYRYQFEKPWGDDRIRSVLDKYMSEHNKKFELYHIEFKIKTNTGTSMWMSGSNIAFACRKVFDRSREITERPSDILEIYILFIFNYMNMTYKHYLTQPKSMLEWTLLRKIARNKELKGNPRDLEPICTYYSIDDIFQDIEL